MMTLVSIAALAAALVALGYAWQLNRELDAARARLDRYNRALFSAEAAIREVRSEVDEVKVHLRHEMQRHEMQRRVDDRFVPTMTVREATLLHPGAAQVLAGFHLGGCDNCAVAPDEMLAALCGRRGVAEEVLLANLNRLLDGSATQIETFGAGDSVKFPNVTLELDL